MRDAGYRCIAPDYAGFGRSDKPTDLGWYTYDRHVELMAALLEELDLRDATAVVHDWGGPIGLRLAVEHPDRFSRIVIMETGPFTGHQRMSDAWLAFRDFVRESDEVPVGMLVRGGCKNDPGDEVIAAYEAPYIDGASKAGARAFPLILPTEPDAPGAAEGKRVADALREDERPALVLWADSDPVLPFSVGERVSSQLNFPAAAADRERLALPAGGRGGGDRADRRRVAWVIREHAGRVGGDSPEQQRASRSQG